MSALLGPDNDARYLIRRAIVELRQHYPLAFADPRVMDPLKAATRAADREEHAKRIRSVVVRCQRGDAGRWSKE